MTEHQRLSERARSALREPLRAFGFRIVVETTDPMFFGNAVVIFANAFRLRLVQDRGQLFFEVASHADPEGWYSLSHAMRALGHTVAIPLDPDDALAVGAPLLMSHHDELARLLRAEDFARSRLDLEKVESLAEEQVRRELEEKESDA